MTPVLYYDENCPVCRIFKNRIEKDVGIGAIEFKPAPAESKTFRYVRSNGGTYLGKDALRMMLNDFPGIAPALNILPAAWKEQVIGATVKAAGLIREAIGKFSQRPGTGGKPGGCGCGKK